MRSGRDMGAIYHCYFIFKGVRWPGLVLKLRWLAYASHPVEKCYLTMYTIAAPPTVVPWEFCCATWMKNCSPFSAVAGSVVRSDSG